jgi:Phage terminase small subunit
VSAGVTCLTLVLVMIVVGLGCLAICFYQEAEQLKADQSRDIAELLNQAKAQVDQWVRQDEWREQRQRQLSR